MKILINNHFININNQFDIDIIMCCKGHMPNEIDDEFNKDLNRVDKLRRILELYYCMPLIYIETEMIYRQLVDITSKIELKKVHEISRELFNNKERINITEVISKYTSYLSDLEIYDV